MFNTNNDQIANEIARLGSVSHRDVEYRRNGTLNYGSQQLVNVGNLAYMYVGIGGPPVVAV
ncbi:hypothetical protein LCGC14_2681110 [marine sediment metagenome]|uniref:Uncharacterized protein n=1 Tax=marine sediment metagenome TaxID=412755 RepID=A0A0F9CD14_9ZZZZ